MIIQKAFKRIKVNAGFTLSVANGVMAVKVSETHYRVLGTTDAPVKADRKELMWVDSAQVKPWWKR
ncbi:hypothetical protein [Serratia phage X20]|uniref:Uncharacterized protein n=1 Tax=Serratia phage X20 TaxID=2006942 RepID=A0A1Z1LYX7_9CAUD|nr:hypothetical protein KNT72_gp056 [Serratia phage X20]ARW58029.1 hypothetical protein [Serratia phage X20]